MELLNNHHPTIKFSYEHSQQEIPFLDTIIYRTRDNHYLQKYTTNQLTKSNTYTFIQPTQENRRKQYLMDC